MKTPLALLAVTVLSPIAATTVLSLGLIASTSAFVLSKMRQQSALAADPDRAPSASSRAPGLRDQLRLDACQDTLWTQAERADLEMNSARLGRLREKYDATLTLLRAPGADLPAVAQSMENFDAEQRALQDGICQRWRAVHETLDAGQKAMASHFFKDKLA